MRNAMLSIAAVVVLTNVPAWAQIAPVPSGNLTDVCRGDFNGDEVVDAADLAEMIGSYGVCRGCDEDFNHDGYVDATDVRLLVIEWGPCTSDEEAFTEPGRVVTDVSDDTEIDEGDVETNDDMLSDQEGRRLERQGAFSGRRRRGHPADSR